MERARQIPLEARSSTKKEAWQSIRAAATEDESSGDAVMVAESADPVPRVIQSHTRFIPPAHPSEYWCAGARHPTGAFVRRFGQTEMASGGDQSEAAPLMLPDVGLLRNRVLEHKVPAL